MIRGLNAGDWQRCYETVDPEIRAKGKPERERYASRLQEFLEAYGQVVPWHTKISLHLDSSTNKHDPRPFAYVYIVWKDAVHEFHMFRERWVKDGGRWYTQVVGLVPAKSK